MKLITSAPIRALLPLILAAAFLPVTVTARETFIDPLDRQTTNWTPSIAGTGPSITFTGGGMLQSYPANSIPDPANNISAVYTPNFLLVGDFDARVDYQIDQYIPVQGFAVSGLRVQLAFNMTSAERVGWENLGYDVYLANDYWNFTTVPTSDLSGTLRIVRQGGQVSSYYKSGNEWKLIAAWPLQSQDLGPVRVTLSSGFPGYAFPGVAMKAAFSNYQVTADKITGLRPEPPAVLLELLAAFNAKHGRHPAPEPAKPQTNSPAPPPLPPTLPIGIRPPPPPIQPVFGPPPPTLPIPPVVSVPPSLEINMAPALSLTGDVGSNYQIEYTEIAGATNAWTSLALVTLTNNPHIYFDATAIGHPSRFYRLHKVP